MTSPDVRFIAKSDARSYFTKKRASFSKEYIAQISKQIANRVCDSQAFRDCRVILLYSAIKNEVNLSKIIDVALLCKKELAFPCSGTQDITLTFKRVKGIYQLVPGAYGIPEPPSDAPVVLPSADTLCIVPALAADLDGHRLGYGKGYYDRFLSSFCGKSLCVIPSPLLCKSLPHDAFDFPVDCIITENETIAIKQNSLF